MPETRHEVDMSMLKPKNVSLSVGNLPEPDKSKAGKVNEGTDRLRGI